MCLIKDREEEKKRKQNSGWRIFVVYTLLFPFALFSALFTHAIQVYFMLPSLSSYLVNQQLKIYIINIIICRTKKVHHNILERKMTNDQTLSLSQNLI